MKRKIYCSILLSVLMGLIVISVGTTAAHDDDADEAGYEVWIIDQSDTRDEDGNGTLESGGTLYIYHGEDLNNRHAANAIPEVLDLGGAARDLCLAQTGTAPRRPHHVFLQRRAHTCHGFICGHRTRALYGDGDANACRMFGRRRPGALFGPIS